MQLEQDESLIPVEEEEVKAPGVAVKAAPLSMLDNLMGGLKLDIQMQAEKSKDQLEFQHKLKELKGKTDAQKVILLKKFINEQNLKNRKMMTKQLRLKKETENSLKLIEEAKVV